MNEIVVKKETFTTIVNEHKKIINHFEENGFKVIQKIATTILTCLLEGGKVLLIGNGGSAADCQHIAGEFVGRYRNERLPLPAISLSADSSVLTCIGNDFDFNNIFSRQIKALGREGDILWAFSTSGSSENIIEGLETAKTQKIKTISFTGVPGSEVEKKSDICLCAGTHYTNHSQEIHQIAYHIICEYIDNHWFNN